MYEAETDGIVVRARPEYLAEDSDPERGRYVWAYTIEIKNRGRETVQLLSRFWRITDANGVTQEVRGEGVVGKQPVIQPGKTFQYTSGCPLSAPSGLMIGAYEMERLGDGLRFDVAVPAFALELPGARPLAN